jgi:hypothetical protein
LADVETDIAGGAAGAREIGVDSKIWDCDNGSGSAGSRSTSGAFEDDASPEEKLALSSSNSSTILDDESEALKAGMTNCGSSLKFRA